MKTVPIDDDTREVIGMIADIESGVRKPAPYWTIYKLAILFIYRRDHALTEFTDLSSYLLWAKANIHLCRRDADGEIKVS